MIIEKSLDSESTPDPLPKGPVVLLLLDGWGIDSASGVNALTNANIPNFSNLINEFPVALLKVGASNWNSRYLSIGAGRESVTENLKPNITLSSILSSANKKQLKIAETERFAALSYFFNGQQEIKYPGEEWKIISSEANQPASGSLLALKQTVGETVKAIKATEAWDFIVVSIPFLSLIAETGDFLNIKKATETLDRNLSTILGAINTQEGILIISAAGGGAERSHNSELDLIDNSKIDRLVPVIIVGAEFAGKTIGFADPLNNDLSLLAPVGSLADLAPTILQIMKLAQPKEMTGQSLLNRK